MPEARNLPFETEVTFGGSDGGEREFGVPAKTVTATFNALCPKRGTASRKRLN